MQSRDAFAVRCGARQRERQLGTGYGYGIFVDGHFAGEINVSSVQRGPFQSAYVGYWIDEARAGNSNVAEALVVVIRHCFEDLRLHRHQIAIIPRNRASRRVVEKLDIREEGTALRYLEINGVWEDHVRYAITAEDWDVRHDVVLHVDDEHGGVGTIRQAAHEVLLPVPTDVQSTHSLRSSSWRTSQSSAVMA